MAGPVLLDQRDVIPLPRDLPTVIIASTHPHSGDPDFWLRQPFSEGLFEQSSTPSEMPSWHRIDLAASDALNGPTTFYIAAEVQILRHLGFFLFSGDRLVQEARLGLLDSEAIGREGRGHADPGPLFPFEVEPGERYTLLIRPDAHAGG